MKKGGKLRDFFWRIFRYGVFAKQKRKNALKCITETTNGNGQIVLTFHIQKIIHAHTDSHTHKLHTSTRGRARARTHTHTRLYAYTLIG
jgi:hypothetical protein